MILLAGLTCAMFEHRMQEHLSFTRTVDLISEGGKI